MDAAATSMLLMVGLTIAYLRKQPALHSESTLAPPSTAREIDVTRWRHDGSQPVNMNDWGNRRHYPDEVVRDLSQTLKKTN